MGMVNLSYAYFHGHGTPKDDAESFKWTSRAANMPVAPESPIAYREMARMFTKGIGVEKNDEETKKWSDKASRRP